MSPTDSRAVDKLTKIRTEQAAVGEVLRKLTYEIQSRNADISQWESAKIGLKRAKDRLEDIDRRSNSQRMVDEARDDVKRAEHLLAMIEGRAPLPASRAAPVVINRPRIGHVFGWV